MDLDPTNLPRPDNLPVIKILLRFPREYRDKAVDLANTIDRYGIGHYVEINDWSGAVKKMYRIDAPENISAFLQQYFNINEESANQLIKQIVGDMPSTI